jgi:hypothetical protein
MLQNNLILIMIIIVIIGLVVSSLSGSREGMIGTGRGSSNTRTFMYNNTQKPNTSTTNIATSELNSAMMSYMNAMNQIARPSYNQQDAKMPVSMELLGGVSGNNSIYSTGQNKAKSDDGTCLSIVPSITQISLNRDSKSSSKQPAKSATASAPSAPAPSAPAPSAPAPSAPAPSAPAPSAPAPSAPAPSAPAPTAPAPTAPAPTAPSAPVFWCENGTCVSGSAANAGTNTTYTTASDCSSNCTPPGPTTTQLTCYSFEGSPTYDCVAKTLTVPAGSTTCPSDASFSSLQECRSQKKWYAYSNGECIGPQAYGEASNAHYGTIADCSAGDNWYVCSDDYKCGSNPAPWKEHHSYTSLNECKSKCEGPQSAGEQAAQTFYQSAYQHGINNTNPAFTIGLPPSGIGAYIGGEAGIKALDEYLKVVCNGTVTNSCRTQHGEKAIDFAEGIAKKFAVPPTSGNQTEPPTLTSSQINANAQQIAGAVSKVAAYYAAEMANATPVSVGAAAAKAASKQLGSQLSSSLQSVVATSACREGANFYVKTFNTNTNPNKLASSTTTLVKSICSGITSDNTTIASITANQIGNVSMRYQLYLGKNTQDALASVANSWSSVAGLLPQTGGKSTSNLLSKAMIDGIGDAIYENYVSSPSNQASCGASFSASNGKDWDNCKVSAMAIYNSAVQTLQRLIAADKRRDTQVELGLCSKPSAGLLTAQADCSSNATWEDCKGQTGCKWCAASFYEGSPDPQDPKKLMPQGKCMSSCEKCYSAFTDPQTGTIYTTFDSPFAYSESGTLQPQDASAVGGPIMTSCAPCGEYGKSQKGSSGGTCGWGIIGTAADGSAINYNDPVPNGGKGCCCPFNPPNNPDPSGCYFSEQLGAEIAQAKGTCPAKPPADGSPAPPGCCEVWGNSKNGNTAEESLWEGCRKTKGCQVCSWGQSAAGTAPAAVSFTEPGTKTQPVTIFNIGVNSSGGLTGKVTRNAQTTAPVEWGGILQNNNGANCNGLNCGMTSAGKSVTGPLPVLDLTGNGSGALATMKYNGSAGVPTEINIVYPGTGYTSESKLHVVTACTSMSTTPASQLFTPKQWESIQKSAKNCSSSVDGCDDLPAVSIQYSGLPPNFTKTNVGWKAIAEKSLNEANWPTCRGFSAPLKCVNNTSGCMKLEPGVTADPNIERQITASKGIAASTFNAPVGNKYRELNQPGGWACVSACESCADKAGWDPSQNTNWWASKQPQPIGGIKQDPTQWIVPDLSNPTGTKAGTGASYVGVASYTTAYTLDQLHQSSQLGIMQENVNTPISSIVNDIVDSRNYYKISEAPQSVPAPTPSSQPVQTPMQQKLAGSTVDASGVCISGVRQHNGQTLENGYNGSGQCPAVVTDMGKAGLAASYMACTNSPGCKWCTSPDSAPQCLAGCSATSLSCETAPTTSQASNAADSGKSLGGTLVVNKTLGEDNYCSGHCGMGKNCSNLNCPPSFICSPPDAGPTPSWCKYASTPMIPAGFSANPQGQVITGAKPWASSGTLSEAAGICKSQMGDCCFGVQPSGANLPSSLSDGDYSSLSNINSYSIYVKDTPACQTKLAMRGANTNLGTPRITQGIRCPTYSSTEMNNLSDEAKIRTLGECVSQAFQTSYVYQN